MIRRFRQAALALLSAASVSVCLGCATRPRHPGRPPPLSLNVYNAGPQSVRDVLVQAGGVRAQFPRLPPGALPEPARAIRAVPATASVAWRTSDGQPRTQQVNIAERVPPDFRGMIVLLLHPDGSVSVKAARAAR